MLQFFRRFQKSIFIGITAIIVISFSFFGTYRAYQQSKGSPDEEVFVSYQGRSVKQSEFDQLVRFIATDQLDSLILGAPLGPNFLNDGVVRKDFLESGLADEIVAHFSKDLEGSWMEKYAREKRFSPYRHQDVDFISATSVWGQFAPDLREAFAAYKRGPFESAYALFDAKKRLYLAESHFPQMLTKRVLTYQMQQNGFAKPDARLQSEDFSLFGYHTVTDWFGSDFVKLVAEVIFNLAEVAEERGYSVTKDEAMADLAKHAQEAFARQKSNPNFALDSAGAYLQQQLRLLGLDSGGAAKMWQKVMLFRALLADVGSSVMLDSQTVAPYADHLSQSAVVTTYRLPKEFHFSHFKDMQLFETYLDQSAKRAQELLSKQFVVEVSRVDQSALLGKVGTKEVWAKELEPAFFEELKKSIPTLGLSDAADDEARLALLNQLDSTTRARADRMARKAVVESHPEWLQEALVNAPFEKKSLTFYKQGGRSPLAGVKQPLALMALIEETEDGQTVTYSEEGVLLRIRPLERSADFTMVSFAKGREDGQLDQLLTKRLEGLHAQLGDGSSFEDVREELAKEAFRPQILRVQREFPEATTPDLVANYRMQSYLKEAKEQLAKGESPILSDPIKWVVSEEKWSREKPGPVAMDELLTMQIGDTAVKHLKDGDHLLFKVAALSHEGQQERLQELLDAADEKLSKEVQKLFMEELLSDLLERGALSLGGAVEG